jgi:shikimate dehydrogenase
MAMMTEPTAFFHLGLTGFPLGHSLSPKLQSAALHSTGLSGEYRLYPVAPFPEGQAAMIALLDRLRSGELQGLNVTIPHKQNVIPLLDELTPAARAIGAVNTISCQENRLVGDNTDAAGFLADLERHTPFISPQNHLESSSPQVPHPLRGLCPSSLHEALVLGAGGSARAVVYALAQAGWRVCIAARRLEQARDLTASLSTGESMITALPLDAATFSRQVSLLVNTTPLGMAPNTEASPWPHGTPFPVQAFVYDLVYNPAETQLLRSARAAGLPAANGLGMLVEQAILGFEIWTGRRPLRQALWQAVAPGQESI